MTYGPPPAIDASVQAILDMIPPMPELTLEAIPTMRINGAALLPTDEALTLNGAFSLSEHLVPGLAGAPDVPVLHARPTAPEGITTRKNLAPSTDPARSLLTRRCTRR